MPPTGPYHPCPTCSRGRKINRDHPQVHLSGEVQQTCVDEKIAPLVAMLWAAGCTTIFSCQGEPGRPRPPGWASITFTDGGSFDRAVAVLWEMAAQSSPPQRARIWDVGRGLRRTPRAWRHGLLSHPAAGSRAYERILVRHRLELPHEDMQRLSDLALAQPLPTDLAGQSGRDVRSR